MRLAFIGLFIFLTFSTTEAVSMPIGEKLYLMSEISGTITLNGQPATGAKLKRIVSKAYSRSELTDETVTDANGYFSMPAVTQRKFVQKIFPMEFVGTAELYVSYQNIEYRVLALTKMNSDKNKENGGKPWVVECELTEALQSFSSHDVWFTTSCNWDAEVDQPIEYGPPIPDDEI